MDIHHLVGKQIRSGRQKARLTIEVLAEASSISPSFLTHIERGTKRASLNTIQRIATGLRISVDKLFSGSTIEKVDHRNRDIQKLEAMLKKSKPQDRRIIQKMIRMLSRELSKR